jgi:large subunit ribosomal protein L13
MDYRIDAKNKKLGRLASEIAVILQGKHSPSYEARLPGDDKVIVTNMKGVVLSGRKVTVKKYYRHSGPLGHLIEKKYKDVFAKNPSWVLKHAVRLMLPKNRLAAKRLKRLIIQD